MKKLILAFVAIAITAGAYAQTDTTNRKMYQRDVNDKQYQNSQEKSVDKSSTDGIVMQNGKVMQTKNGQTSVLNQKITLSDGTQIMADGTCIKKDGSKMTLKEGQRMDLSGNVVTGKTNKDKNMYLVPDSTKKDGKN
jgi:hypothetical protein